MDQAFYNDKTINQRGGLIVKELNELYEAIKDVVATNEELGLDLGCIKTLKEKYNTLCECEEEKI